MLTQPQHPASHHINARGADVRAQIAKYRAALHAAYPSSVVAAQCVVHTQDEEALAAPARVASHVVAMPELKAEIIRAQECDSYGFESKRDCAALVAEVWAAELHEQWRGRGESGRGQAPRWTLQKTSPIPQNCALVTLGKESALMRTIRLCFAKHYGLSLSPEVVWAQVLAGVSAHIRANVELYRGLFVDHAEGKVKLTVRRGMDFLPGNFDTDWESVIRSFAEDLGREARHQQLFECDFSGSTDTDRCVARIISMHAMGGYFDY